MLPRPDVVALLTAATVFACPSIYEPLGIVNLEAMACETAVVATATGGIPEVVVPGETGLLVPIEQATDGTGTPLDPERYVADFADALNELVCDADRAAAYGRAGRQRAIESFAWSAIAERTRGQIYDVPHADGALGRATAVVAVEGRAELGGGYAHSSGRRAHGSYLAPRRRLRGDQRR